jgi:hypothetical protein
MNYRNRTKERNVKKLIYNIFNIFSFKNLDLDFSSKIIIIWNLILLTSLFFPWLIKTDENLIWNSFNQIWWNIGFFSIFLIIFTTFITVCFIKSEKIKLALSISFKNYLIIILSWIFIIVIWIVYISFINWLTIFSKNIIMWRWVVLFILWWIVITIWWLLKKNNYNNNEYESFIHETKEENIVKNNKSNMKLPF